MTAYSVVQSCPTLCDPMDCSPPGSSVHGIFQARILEWVAISSCSESFQPKDRTHISCVSCIAGGLFTTEAPEKPSFHMITCDLFETMKNNIWSPSIFFANFMHIFSFCPFLIIYLWIGLAPCHEVCVWVCVFLVMCLCVCTWNSPVNISKLMHVRGDEKGELEQFTAWTWVCFNAHILF